MTNFSKIPSAATTGKLLSVLVMIFLLGFLTVSNAYLYGNKPATEKKAACSDQTDEDGAKRPISPEEEKSSSRSLPNSVNEEYLHEHDLFTHLYVTASSAGHQYVHPHGFGDDHSSLDCPPPDRS